MQDIFRKATRYLSTADMVVADFPPFGRFAPADDLKQFFRELGEHQSGRSTALEGGFVYGGAFADLASDRKPKDYDIYLASPGMVESIRRFSQTGGLDEGYNEWEWAEVALGYNLPFVPMTEGTRVMQSDLLGDHVEFVATTEVNGTFYKVDLKIGQKNISPTEFLSHTPAPIMAAAMMLGEGHEKPYTWHRDMTDHAQRNLLVTVKADSPQMIEKAQRKGLTLILPETAPKLAVG